MSYLHPIEIAQKFSNFTMKRIEKDSLVPSPENYELWFSYFSKSDAELIKALDIYLEENNGKITDEQCCKVYNQFLSNARADETISRAGNQIKDAIGDVNIAITSAKKYANEYSDNLVKVNDELKQDKTKDEIDELVSTVLDDTKNMLEYNDHLEDMLAHSNRAMEDMRRDLERAKKEAMTDSLTGLANRKAFDHEINHLISLSNNDDEPHIFSMIILDIDHFKKFNDTFGHQVGDQVLKLVARTLKDSVKGRDIAVRYGGEEFVILLPETGINGGVKIAEILRMEIEKKEVINRTTGKNIAKITFSAGVSQYIKNEDKDVFIERVDTALYKAKETGRNRVVASVS